MRLHQWSRAVALCSRGLFSLLYQSFSARVALFAWLKVREIEREADRKSRRTNDTLPACHISLTVPPPPLSSILVIVAIDCGFQTAKLKMGVCCGEWFSVFLLLFFSVTSRNPAADWPSSPARAVHQSWERLSHQVYIAPIDLHDNQWFSAVYMSRSLSYLTGTLKLYITQVVVEPAVGDRKPETSLHRQVFI